MFPSVLTTLKSFSVGLPLERCQECAERGTYLHLALHFCSEHSTILHFHVCIEIVGTDPIPAACSIVLIFILLCQNCSPRDIQINVMSLVCETLRPKSYHYYDIVSASIKVSSIVNVKQQIKCTLRQ